MNQHELPTHSLVLATQSEFFNTALKGPFVEGNTKEFRFTEGSMHAHWRVFEYMYTGRYSEDPAEALGAQGITYYLGSSLEPG